MQSQKAHSRQPININSSMEYHPSAESEQIMNSNTNDDLFVRAQYETSRRMRIPPNVNMNANALRPPKHKTSSVPYRSKNITSE